MQRTHETRSPLAASLVLAALVAASCAATDGEDPVPDLDRAACLALLEAQRDAWNDGDIEGYLAGYHESPDIVFVSAAGAHVGYDALRERYLGRYPDRSAMGRLTFDDMVFTRLGVDTLSATGRWSLQRVDDSPHGRFVLVFRRVEVGWRIVLDYTASESA